MTRTLVTLGLSLVAATTNAGCPSNTAKADRSSGPPCGASSAEYDIDGERYSDAGCCASSFAIEPSCKHPEVIKDCHDGFCRIPAGCFVMGSASCAWGRGRYSEPETQVTLTRAFEIQQYEMTQGQWTALGLDNPSGREDERRDGLSNCLDPDCPVAFVTLFEALEAANRLSAAHQPPLKACYALKGCTGTPGHLMVCDEIEQTVPSLYECEGYRLPTEAEWEYATRAGTRTAFYSGDIEPTGRCAADENLRRIAWYCSNSSRSTHPVGRKEPNAWGLYDTSGNVAEWVSASFDGLGYGPGPQVDPMPVLRLTPETSGVTRGGRFYGSSMSARSAWRSQHPWEGAEPGLGFRLARTLR